MPGANPANAPPAIAAVRVRATCRENNQNQAYAVPARFSVIAVTNATDGPAMIVTGMSRTASTVIEVLAAMLTPSGAFSIDVHSGLSPCVTAWLTYPRSHSKNTWSARLCVSSVEFGAAHSRAVTTPAASRNPSATSTSVRRDFRAVRAPMGRPASPTATVSPAGAVVGVAAGSTTSAEEASGPGRSGATCTTSRIVSAGGGRPWPKASIAVETATRR